MSYLWTVRQMEILGWGFSPFPRRKVRLILWEEYFLWVLNDTNEEKEEIQARILAANKAYSTLQFIF